jgi:ABC-type polysaccharide/polyol phosphate export permease
MQKAQIKNFKDQTYQAMALTQANLKARYRNSFSGFLWVILNPLLMFSAQGFAFHYILKINVDHFPLFLITGLLPWMFLSQTIDMSASILTWQGRMLKSFRLNPMVFIFAQVFDNAINFFAALLIALLGIGFFSDFDWWHLLYLPLCLIPLFIATLSMSWLFSGLQVLIKDLKFVLSFILNISYFLTPIFYPRDFAPENWRWIFDINPIYHLIMPFRNMAFDPLSPAFFNSLSFALILSLVMLALATWFWRKKKNVIYFYL